MIESFRLKLTIRVSPLVNTTGFLVFDGKVGTTSKDGVLYVNDYSVQATGRCIMAIGPGMWYCAEYEWSEG